MGEQRELQEVSKVEAAGTRINTLHPHQRYAFFSLVMAGIIASIIFVFSIPIFGRVMIEWGYYWLFNAIFGSLIFLILPAHKKATKVPWYDYLLIITFLGVCFFNFITTRRTVNEGWECLPAGIIVLPFLIEAARRGGGLVFFLVVVTIATYPLYADALPGIFWGRAYDLDTYIRILVFRYEGLMGIPMRVLGRYLIGFFVFAGVLVASGGGDFFLRLASSLVGRYRGGPAKIAVVSSGFFGSLSGSAISNVAATGSFTIPMMKRIGYPPYYAAAIEACASTGGILMPPVMGAIAFIMAEFIGVPYGDIVKAAAIPGILYYTALLLQVDAYAARVGLVGMSNEEIPRIKTTLKNGWPFILVLAFLIWGLVWMRWEEMTPWYASALMVVLSYYRKETRISPRRLYSVASTIGVFVVKSAAVILPISFIMAGLVITGVSLSLTSAIVDLGQNNIFLVLILGVIICYIMGMAGVMSPAYIFLAVALVPAVLAIAPLNKLSVHLFILYYCMLASITLPVATAVFVAAAMAGSSIMKTGLLAMRMALVIYFVPFFFVFDPALIFQGDITRTIYLVALCIVGCFFIAAGAEGYLFKIGRVNWWARLPLIAAGMLIGFPEWTSTIIGFIVAAVFASLQFIKNNFSKTAEH